MLDNPEVAKLAPFSSALVSGKKPSKYTSLTSANSRGFGDGSSSCLKSIAERKTILKEIQNLSEALVIQQSKFELALEKIKEEKRKYKKSKRHTEKNELKKQDHIDYLKRRIEDLKRNEENLLEDLVQQQTISKDALKCLDNLKLKFDDEKRIMKEELDQYYALLLEQEHEKYSTLQLRYKTLEPLEKQVKEFEVKLSNSERLAKEQRESIHNLQSLLEEANDK